LTEAPWDAEQINQRRLLVMNQCSQTRIMLIDAGYGNNTTFLLELEKRKLKYLGGLAKNRK
jgi:SRSO17 transposase